MDPFRIAVAEAPDTAAALLPPDAAERLAERIHRLRGSAPTVEVVTLPDVALDRLDPATITGSGAHAVILSVASEMEGGHATKFAAAADDLISSVRAKRPGHISSGSPHPRSTRRAATPTAPDRSVSPSGTPARCRTRQALQDSRGCAYRRRPDRGRAWRRRPRSGTAPLLAGGIRGARRGDGARPRRHRVLRAAPIGSADRRRGLRCATTSTSPHLDRRVGQARLLQWHVAEGAEVGYGDPLVDIIADELTTLEVHRSAKYLTKLAGRKVEPAPRPRG